jgi:hypothetical protein
MMLAFGLAEPLPESEDKCYQIPTIFIHAPPASSQIAMEMIDTRKLTPHH